jgi:hypothetical protein
LRFLTSGKAKIAKLEALGAQRRAALNFAG